MTSLWTAVLCLSLHLLFVWNWKGSFINDVTLNSGALSHQLKAKLSQRKVIWNFIICGKGSLTNDATITKCSSPPPLPHSISCVAHASAEEENVGCLAHEQNSLLCEKAPPLSSSTIFCFNFLSIFTKYFSFKATLSATAKLTEKQQQQQQQQQNWRKDLEVELLSLLSILQQATVLSISLSFSLHLLFLWN